MTVTFQLPDEIEKSLRREFSDLNAAAKEAALVELYRQDKISPRELSHALGIDRLEVHAVLKRHNVTEDLPTAKEHAQALARLRAKL